MSTIYQFSRDGSYLTKDMVFGWVARVGRSVYVFNQLTLKQTEDFLSAIPSLSTYEEPRTALLKRRAELMTVVARQKNPATLTATQEQKIDDPVKDLRAQVGVSTSSDGPVSEREKTLAMLEAGLRSWFKVQGPTQLYEVKSEFDDYVYCRVVPHINGGYSLVNSKGRVVASVTDLKEAAETILRFWW